MTRKELQKRVETVKEDRYKELLENIQCYIARRAFDAYLDAIVFISDWSYMVNDDRDFYPIHMYERAMKEVKATGCTVKRWSFLGFRLGAWTISWGEK